MAINRKVLAPLVYSLSLALVAQPSALAQPTGARSLHAGTLEVPINKSQVVSADRPIAKAMVGSADIADVLPVTDRSIYVLGKKMGTTSLTLYDGAGRVISIMDIAVGPDVDALTDQLRQLIPGQAIEAHITNESLVLTGTVNSAGAADRAAQLAHAYAGDKVINLIAMGASQQVMLEVRFAEVSRSAGKDIGVSAGARSNNGSFRGVSGLGASVIRGKIGTTDILKDAVGNIIGSTTTGAVPEILAVAAASNSFGIFQKSFNIGNVSIDAQLNALESRGLAKTLAQPTLIALSGEKASFLAGGEFPVPVVQSGGGGGGGNNGNGAITVEFKAFGVSLAFTPTVLGDKVISMIVEPEVSAIDPTASLTVGNITIPGLKTRRAITTLELRDGESFAMAGLLQKDFKTTVDQVPLLGSVPILGALFRSSSFQKGETELLIVVTPHLVQPIAPGQVKLPTDRVKDPSEVETILLGQPYHPLPVQPSVPPAAAPASPQSLAPASAPAVAEVPPARKEDGYAY